MSNLTHPEACPPIILHLLETLRYYTDTCHSKGCLIRYTSTVLSSKRNSPHPFYPPFLRDSLGVFQGLLLSEFLLQPRNQNGLISKYLLFGLFAILRRHRTHDLESHGLPSGRTVHRPQWQRRIPDPILWLPCSTKMVIVRPPPPILSSPPYHPPPILSSPPYYRHIVPYHSRVPTSRSRHVTCTYSG